MLRPSLTHACVKKPVRNESNPIPTFRPAPARLESDLKNGAQKGADHIPKTEFTGTHRHRPYASTDFRIKTVLDYPCERYRESYPGHSTLDPARPNQPAFFLPSGGVIVVPPPRTRAITKSQPRKVQASLYKTCPKRGFTITPGMIRRVDFEQIECPKCGERFQPATP